MSDLQLVLDGDGGDLVFADNDLAMASGIVESFTVSLFGGNIQDDGLENSEREWWGNVLDADPAKKIRSLTQHLINNLDQSRNSLLRIQDAVKSDLAWMIEQGLITSLNVDLAVESSSKLNITIQATANSQEIEQRYVINWERLIQQ
jgi:phage gp46-like protein